MKNLLLLFLGLISCAKTTASKNDLQKLHDISGEVTQILEKIYNYDENGKKELWFEKTYKFNELGNTILITDIWQIYDKATYITSFEYDSQNRIVKEATTKNKNLYAEINYTYSKDTICFVDTRSDTLYEKRTKVFDKKDNIVFEQIFDPKGDFIDKREYKYSKNNIRITQIRQYQVLNKNFFDCCELKVYETKYKYDKNNFLISEYDKNDFSASQAEENATIWKYPVLDKNNNWTTKRTYFSKDYKIPTIEIERKIIYKK
jgi:hypothetical protein